MKEKEKLRIGITGQSGFIGTHLYNELGLYPEKYARIPFEDDYFSRNELLYDFVKRCDIIVHLAAVNRYPDPVELYKINIQLVNSVIDALNHENVKPHIIFSSSIHESLDNQYGKSKLEGRRLFEQWARKCDASFTGLIIPNVFGPFGLPNYNSFISTFCHKLTHDEEVEVINDNDVNLIYISSLCHHIKANIDNVVNSKCSLIEESIIYPDFTKKVSDILILLNTYKEQYYNQGIIPYFSNMNEINLFNTYRSYIDISRKYPILLKQNIDERGIFVETARMGIGGQASFSITKPGITRGNHYHTRKIERFTVISGKAKIQLRRIGTEQVYDFYLDGKNPSFVDMPIWFTHNISNIGNDDLYTLFWINEWYDSSNPDTFFEKV